MKDTVINSASDAFTLAINLAATAPTNEKAQECLKLAFDISSKLDPKELGLCFMAAAVVTEFENQPLEGRN